MQMMQWSKIRRIIGVYGQECVITRAGVNDFGEPVGSPVTVLSCRGLYHDATGHLSISLDDAGAQQEQKRPSVLTAYSGDVQIGDTVTINGKSYHVTGIKDIGNCHEIIDIALGGDVDD